MSRSVLSERDGLSPRPRRSSTRSDGAVVLLACLLLLGCEGSVSGLATDDAGAQVDAGAVVTGDAGGLEPDGGVALDAGAEPDAGEADAGTIDAGDADAGASDAGLTDAGTADAGGVDVGEPDAGGPDAGGVVVPDAGLSSTRYTPVLYGATDAGNGYWEYLPPGYGDGQLRPLLVFWHGIGENDSQSSGSLSELQRVTNFAIPRLIRDDAWPNTRPFIVLSPQHRGGGCPSANEVRDFIAYAARTYAVDPRRLYLTGLSCGAIGSWSYLASYLDQQVAAAVLIAGDPGDPGQSWSAWGRNMCNLGRVPLWVFHGSADSVVNVTNDRETMVRLIACPQPPRLDARYTEYAGVDHDSWTMTYDLSAGHDIYAWLLLQSK